MTKYFSDTLNVISHIHPETFPFPHGVTTNCLPDFIYKELVATRPGFVVENGGNNKRYDINAIQALQGELPPIWRDFIEYHTSKDFYHQILIRFQDDFQEFYPELKGMKDYKVGRRFDGSDSDIFLECQISINTPVTTKGTVAPPHVDNPNSLWASLLYMKEEGDDAGGDLVLHKCVRAPKFHGKRNCPVELVRPVAKIPYAANTYACFINSPVSVHSVTDRDVTDKQRLMVNITLEFNEKKLFEV